MKRAILIAFVIVGALVFLLACDKSTDPDPEPETFDPPTNLTYLTYQDSVKLAWNASPDAGDDGFAGYLVYRNDNLGFAGMTEEQLAGLSPMLVTDVNATMVGLASSIKHFFAVRAIKVEGDDTTLSSLSNAVDTSPTIWFSDTIWEVEGGAEALSAIDFRNQRVLPMTGANLTFIDIYLGVDESNDLALKSPRLFPGWAEGGRETYIKLLGVPEEGKGLATYNTPGTVGTTEMVILGQPQRIYAIKAGSNYGKLYLVSFVGGAPPTRGIYFEAAFQDVEDYARF